MPSGLLLHVPWRGGLRQVIARELTAAEFFQGYPDAPDDHSRAAAIARLHWEDHVLCRAAVQPGLVPMMVVRIGHQERLALLHAYFAAVGWMDGPPAQECPLPEGQTGSADAGPMALPPVPWRAAVVAVAREFGRLPLDAWRLPISQFLFCARLLCEALERENDAHEKALQRARVTYG